LPGASWEESPDSAGQVAHVWSMGLHQLVGMESATEKIPPFCALQASRGKPDSNLSVGLPGAARRA